MAISTMMGFLEKKEVGVVGGLGGKSGMYGAWWWTPEQCVYGEDSAEVGFTLILCLFVTTYRSTKAPPNNVPPDQIKLP